MLESMEIQRMRDDYKKKVHQIEFDFFVAMTPLLERMKVSPLCVHDILNPSSSVSFSCL